jgi:hypothetical protein
VNVWTDSLQMVVSVVQLATAVVNLTAAWRKRSRPGQAAAQAESSSEE